ncbi:hypothetical protein [Pseudoroseomonas cervicalis]|uniref:hypothetical protein n=1 Tax=Teichococcus cervicalis TaxID=204525 RepID=UPI0022F1CC7C|nr:hypothetical protein [Pseudoroseomonas cervicalis]WBV42563.1 hypothetical protein PFY06_15160 [Pseudoroseomonas cervicalis]
MRKEIGNEPLQLGPIARQPRKPLPLPVQLASRLRLDDPAEAAAHAMLRRLFEAAPTLRGRASEAGAVLLVEVPDDEWVAPVAETCRILVPAPDAVLFGRDNAGNRPYRQISRSNRAGPPSAATARTAGTAPVDGNGAFPTMIAADARSTASAQRPVYGVSPAPAPCLPLDLLRAATVAIGPLDPAALAEAATMRTGAASVTASLPLDGARLVTVGDLGLA